MDPSLPSSSRRDDASPQGEGGDDLKELHPRLNGTRSTTAIPYLRTRRVLGLVKGHGSMASGKIRLIHSLLNQDKAVQGRNLIRITNQNHVR